VISEAGTHDKVFRTQIVALRDSIDKRVT
jgi:hypothetical protein